MNSLEELVKKYSTDYEIVGMINLDNWYSFSSIERTGWLRAQLKKIYQSSYQTNSVFFLR
jgi:hypothetical protein